MAAPGPTPAALHGLNPCGHVGQCRVALHRRPGAWFRGPNDIAAKNAVYREAFRKRTLLGIRSASSRLSTSPHFALVLVDREKARRIGLLGQWFSVESLFHWYSGGFKPDIADLDAENSIAALTRHRQETVA